MKIVLAYSGGLDTSFAVHYCTFQQAHEIHAAVADTGAFSAEKIQEMESRAMALGAKSFTCLDIRQEVFDRFFAYVVKGNLLRGGVYPLCVAAERTAQAEAIASHALALGAEGIAHGSTAAGNDQIRFDLACAAMAPDLAILAPVRDLGWTRDQEADYLAQNSHPVDSTTSTYSVNESLWGVTIGGGETHDPWEIPPESVYQMTRPVDQTPSNSREICIGFQEGIPTSLDHEDLSGPTLIARLNDLAGEHGVGRGFHLGETVLGIKGRIAFEAPAPIVLIQAHRELEKLVLTQGQLDWLGRVSLDYGNRLHEGHYHAPVMRDLEALIDHAQRTVFGEVRVRLHRGLSQVLGVRSPKALLDPLARYGEETQMWNGRDAEGFGRISGISSRIASRRDQRGTSP